jgi:hypothetical protein
MVIIVTNPWRWSHRRGPVAKAFRDTRDRARAAGQALCQPTHQRAARGLALAGARRHLLQRQHHLGAGLRLHCRRRFLLH